MSQIVSKASEPFFDDWYPPKNWFRTAEVVYKQGNVYLREANLQAAYFLLYRHAKLVLEDLPQHSQAGAPQYKRNWVLTQKDAEQSLELLEQLKPRINKRYERFLNKRKEAKDKAQKERREEQELHFDTLGDGDTKLLDPSEDADVGVKMANTRTWIRNRETEGRSMDQTPVDSEDLELMMRHARRQYVRNTASFPTADYSAARSDSSPIAYMYPAVYRRDDLPPASTNYSENPPPSSMANSHGLDTAPLVPLKRLDSFAPLSAAPHKSLSIPQVPPTIPPKTPLTGNDPGAMYSSSRATTLVQSLEQFKLISSLESGLALRTVFLPRDLRHSFLHLASKNTTRGLETLGLLCGHLLRNAFFVTALLLPPQTSTSDTCEMTDEGEIVVDQFVSTRSTPDPRPSSGHDHSKPISTVKEGHEDSTGSDMMVLGWIHTHPTQTCFLSSRDLHTHVWYQSSLPESIAIVCAPSKSAGLGSEWNAFRLTDPPGMNVVRNCRRDGVFHPHEEVDGGIYTDAVGRPGHVIEVGSLDFEVSDMRDVRT